MSFILKEDYEEVKKRFEAFWELEIIDRPLVSFSLPADSQKQTPEKDYSSHEARWLDIEFRAEQLFIEAQNREYWGEELPIIFPNMGPEIFSAWCGCPYHFGARTTWSEPVIKDWEKDFDKARFDDTHPLYRLTHKFTDILLELAGDHCIIGFTDFHPRGDHIAALRDPQMLALDMIENPDWVQKMLDVSYPEYKRAYNSFYKKLSAAGMPSTTWLHAIHEGTFYVPCNDFSCMISTGMFQEQFLPGIISECRFFERSIYHLDGPGALRHLDTLLEIPELDAVQWVPGAGNEGFSRWIPVYKKIQDKGKAIEIVSVTVDDLPLIFENLRPEGVLISHLAGVDSAETAREVLRRVSMWK